MKKLYLLSKAEQNMIDNHRKFITGLIKEKEEIEQLLNRQSKEKEIFYEHSKVLMRQCLARGEKFDIDKSLYPHQPPINQIFYYLKERIRKK